MALILGSVVSACAGGPNRPKILEAMAVFDRAYIPALVFSDLGKQRETELSLEHLRRSWNDFHLNFYNTKIKYGVNIVDKFWQEDFSRVDALITSAEVLISQHKLIGVNEQLEPIRIIFMDLRKRNGLLYFLDGLTTFDGLIDEISNRLVGKVRLQDKEIRELQALADTASQVLQGLSDFELKPKLFGFNSDKLAAINARLLEQQRLVQKLSQVIQARDLDAVFQSAQDLKPNFIVLYKAFGGFQPIFDAIIKEKQDEPKDNKLDKTKSK